MTLGVIISNRDVFPTSLAVKGRENVLAALKKAGIRTIVLPAQRGNDSGLVETYQHAKKCAALFDKHHRNLDGVLVSLPNFGDERAISDTLKMAKLDVPVFVHAFADNLDSMQIGKRRDSFCGKLSVCNNLRQYGISYSVGKVHVVSPDSDCFLDELRWFLGVCRATNGLRSARIGMIGSRIAPFKTVRFSEKILEANGITVETADMYDIISGVEKLSNTDTSVKAKLSELNTYAPPAEKIPPEHQITLAKIAIVLDRWVNEHELDAYTIQCWPVMQETLGVFPCVVMSMMSGKLIPSACETDMMGAVSMYALQLASNTPAALFDWNNNYGNDLNRMVFFHCCNSPKRMLDRVQTGVNVIAEYAIGKNKSYTVCYGRLKRGPFTFARVTTDDAAGRIISCIGQGEFTDDPLETFGGTGVARIENLQALMGFLCKNGFEHHAALSLSQCADILHEAFTTYLGWDVYYHNRV